MKQKQRLAYYLLSYFLKDTPFSIFYPELEVSAAAPAPNRTTANKPAPAAARRPPYPPLRVVVSVILEVVVLVTGSSVKQIHYHDKLR